MAVEQLELADRAPRKLRVGRDDGLEHADLVAWCVDLVSLAFAGQLQLLECDDPLQCGRLALQDENVAGLDHDVAGGLVTPLRTSEQSDDLDPTFAEIFQSLHRQACGGRVLGHGHLGRVAFEIEGRVHRDRTFSILR